MRNLATLLLLASSTTARASLLRDVVPLRHTVAAWPSGADSSRWVLRVPIDADAVRFVVPFNRTGLVDPALCILGARTGRRVRNLRVHFGALAAASFLMVEEAEGPQQHLMRQFGPYRVSGRRHQQLLGDESDGGGGRAAASLLAEPPLEPPSEPMVGVFEPDSGPGEYELYRGCADDSEGAPPDEHFLSSHSAMPSLASLPAVHVLREEPRCARCQSRPHAPRLADQAIARPQPNPLLTRPCAPSRRRPTAARRSARRGPSTTTTTATAARTATCARGCGCRRRRHARGRCAARCSGAARATATPTRRCTSSTPRGARSACTT